MNIPQVIEVADRLFLEYRNKPLSDLEKEIIRGTLKDFSYERLAEKMECSVANVSITGSRLWSKLSEILGTEINKRNFKTIVEKVDIEHDISETIQDFKASNILASTILNKGELTINISSEEIEPNKPTSKPKKIPTDNYVEIAPEHFNCYGREEELKTLQKWILEERDRVITLLGFPGIGKTTLSLKLAEQMKPHFDAIVYRSLSTSPTLHALIVDILESLGYLKNYAHHLDKHISRLKKVISHRNYLFIFDHFENVFTYEELAGTYHKKQEVYQLLFDIFATTSNQSCLLLCSREKPSEIVQWQGEKSPIRSFELKGSRETAIAIFQAQELSDEKSWETAIEDWQGHPLQLQEMAILIQEMFGGDTSQFIEYSRDVIGKNLKGKIEKHLERLSEFEKDILLAFSDENDSLPIGELMQKSGLIPSEFFNVVQSLQHRFCLETEQKERIKHFSLTPILQKYLRLHPLE